MRMHERMHACARMSYAEACACRQENIEAPSIQQCFVGDKPAPGILGTKHARAKQRSQALGSWAEAWQGGSLAKLGASSKP